MYRHGVQQELTPADDPADWALYKHAVGIFVRQLLEAGMKVGLPIKNKKTKQQKKRRKEGKQRRKEFWKLLKEDFQPEICSSVAKQSFMYQSL